MSSVALSLLLPWGFLRLITHNRLFVFTTGLWSVTVIEQQSVLSYVYSNQLRLEIGEEGETGRGKKETHRYSLSSLFIHTYGTH